MITAIAITLDLVFGVKSGKVGQTYDTGFPKSMVNVIYQGAHPLSLYPTWEGVQYRNTNTEKTVPAIWIFCALLFMTPQPPSTSQYRRRTLCQQGCEDRYFGPRAVFCRTDGQGNDAVFIRWS